jgi:hypothetical protein
MLLGTCLDVLIECDHMFGLATHPLPLGRRVHTSTCDLYGCAELCDALVLLLTGKCRVIVLTAAPHYLDQSATPEQVSVLIQHHTLGQGIRLLKSCQAHAAGPSASVHP